MVSTVCYVSPLLLSASAEAVVSPSHEHEGSCAMFTILKCIFFSMNTALTSKAMKDACKKLGRRNNWQEYILQHMPKRR